LPLSLLSGSLAGPCGACQRRAGSGRGACIRAWLQPVSGKNERGFSPCRWRDLREMPAPGQAPQERKASSPVRKHGVERRSQEAPPGAEEQVNALNTGSCSNLPELLWEATHKRETRPPSPQRGSTPPPDTTAHPPTIPAKLSGWTDLPAGGAECPITFSAARPSLRP
jgi:hypothetical protein